MVENIEKQAKGDHVMRKKLILFFLLSVMIFCTSCGVKEEGANNIGDSTQNDGKVQGENVSNVNGSGESNNAGQSDNLNLSESNREHEGVPTGRIAQTGQTVAVPSDYMEPAAQQGTVVDITYSSKDYAGDGSDLEKVAYIYLPYGYDETDTETRYDILYLMHGWGGMAGEYFTFGNGRIKNMLDWMIANGEIQPMIVVSATFYNDGSSQDFGSSTRELREFHQDFVNNLMPAVEGQYHTYARSASEKDLIASRDHRGFGGFSLGSVTTWNEFCYDYDYIRYFLPMSGACWYYGGYGDYHPEETSDFFEELIAENDLNERGYFIYVATGTDDSQRGQVDIQMDEMLKRSNVFTSDHVVYYMKDGGRHDLDAVQEYLYNALPFFFID